MYFGSRITSGFTGSRRSSCKQKKPRGPRLRVHRIVIPRSSLSVGGQNLPYDLLVVGLTSTNNRSLSSSRASKSPSPNSETRSVRSLESENSMSSMKNVCPGTIQPESESSTSLSGHLSSTLTNWIALSLERCQVFSPPQYSISPETVADRISEARTPLLHVSGWKRAYTNSPTATTPVIPNNALKLNLE